METEEFNFKEGVYLTDRGFIYDESKFGSSLFYSYSNLFSFSIGPSWLQAFDKLKTKEFNSKRLFISDGD